jgi:hypothetical protein
MTKADKQVLRAFGAQDDKPPRVNEESGRKKNGEFSFLPLFSQETSELVILSERAARARAKDLLVGMARGVANG